MTKLTETQTLILTAGANRPDNIAMPLPKGLAGAAAKMAVSKMIERGWLQELRLCYRKDFMPTACDRGRAGAKDNAPLKIWRGL